MSWEDMWNIEHLSKKYNFVVSGICHVGAYKAEEIKQYRSLFGDVPVIFIEANADLEDDIINNISPFNNVRYEITAAGATQNESKMYLHTTSEGPGQSSSLYKPKEHLIRYGFPTTEHTRTIKINTLDNIIGTDNVNFLNIDVQGYELEVLRGSTNTLDVVDYIIIEINRKEMYEGCPLVEDIDDFLGEYCFVRRESEWWEDKEDWGDALYIKETE